MPIDVHRPLAFTSTSFMTCLRSNSSSPAKTFESGLESLVSLEKQGKQIAKVFGIALFGAIEYTFIHAHRWPATSDMLFYTRTTTFLRMKNKCKKKTTKKILGLYPISWFCGGACTSLETQVALDHSTNMHPW